MSSPNQIDFRQTEAALYELSAQMRHGYGEHYASEITSGDVALQFGVERFDHAEHDLEDVQPCIEEEFTGGLYVPTGLAARPLEVNVVMDRMRRGEDPLFTRQKTKLSADIAAAIGYAAPSTDPVTGNVVSDQPVEQHDFRHVIKADTRPDGTKRIQHIALGGLAVVISDFHNMDFKPGSLAHAVAIKVNHQYEREVPAGDGLLLLGGDVELNTNNPRKLSKYNEPLYQKHQETLYKLKRAGAHIVSVVADGRIEPHGFDAAQTDKQLAKAIELSSR